MTSWKSQHQDDDLGRRNRLCPASLTPRRDDQHLSYSLLHVLAHLYILAQRQRQEMGHDKGTHQQELR